MSHQIQIIAPGLPLVRFKLRGEGPWVVGSSTESDIPLRVRGVSRKHAELFRGGSTGLCVRDLESTNGILVNGVPAEVAALSPGYRLDVGHAALFVQDVATEAMVACGADLSGIDVSSVLEVPHGPEAASGAVAGGALHAAMSGLLRQMAEAASRHQQWEMLCACYVESLGCSAGKIYGVSGERVTLPASFGAFPDDRVPPSLAQACALFPHAMAFEKRDPGLPQLGLVSLPTAGRASRAVFLGVRPGGFDPLRAYPELVPALMGLAALVLHWAEGDDVRGAEISALRESLRRAAPGGDGGAHEPAIGRSPAFLAAKEAAARAASCGATVLLLGETGTGKDLMAKYIHDISARSGGPFVPINCAAIPASLMESELFGVERGAFTGADRARPGKIADASGGTLLLDEIAELAPPLQAALLRVVEDRTVTPLGGRPRTVDVRFVAATNKDLRRCVEDGSFRKDLYFRISGEVVDLPPLRERGGDVALLARAFLDAACREFGLRVMGFEEGALQLLSAHAWPGNVRELLSAVKHLSRRTSGASITAADVRGVLGRTPPRASDPSTEPWGLPWKDASAAFEREYFSRRVAGRGGAMSAVARDVGISRANLYIKLRKHGLWDGGRAEGGAG